MTGEPAQSERSDNLFEPVDADPGVHGRFDARSAGRVFAASSGSVRAGLLGAALAGCVLLAASGRR
jgi:hypothetical protein